MIKQLILLGILCIPLAQAETTDTTKTPWQIDRLETDFSLKGISTVIIKNDFGNIRTRGGGNGELQTFSVFQHHAQDKVTPQITQQRKQDTLTIEVLYPTSEKTVPDQQNRRTDFSAFIPVNIDLSLSTTFGYAESKGHKGTLTIKTESGNIRIKAAGVVNARSNTGSIYATHKKRQWTHDAQYQTLTGDIKVELFATPNVIANIETAGEIATDYSIQINPQPGSAKKIAVAKIGKPLQQLKISSQRGKITLARIFAMLSTTKKQGQ